MADSVPYLLEGNGRTIFCNGKNEEFMEWEDDGTEQELCRVSVSVFQLYNGPLTKTMRLGCYILKCTVLRLKKLKEIHTHTKL